MWAECSAPANAHSNHPPPLKLIIRLSPEVKGRLTLESKAGERVVILVVVDRFWLFERALVQVEVVLDFERLRVATITKIVSAAKGIGRGTAGYQRLSRDNRSTLRFQARWGLRSKHAAILGTARLYSGHLLAPCPRI